MCFFFCIKKIRKIIYFLSCCYGFAIEAALRSNRTSNTPTTKSITALMAIMRSICATFPPNQAKEIFAKQANNIPFSARGMIYYPA